MASETMKTPMADYGKPTSKPTGHVTTDGKSSTVDLPTRTTGPDSLPEVTYDENGGLPARS